MSNWGIELKMKPQEIIENATVSGEPLFVTVHTSIGSFQFILSNHPGNINIELKADRQQLV